MAADTCVRNDVVCVEPTGDWNMAGVESAMAEAQSLVCNHNLQKVLVDIRDARLKLSVTQIYYIGAAVREMFPPDTRHAIVVNASTPDEDDARFVEDTTVNRGVLLRYFTDERDALTWLAKENGMSSL